MPSLFGDEFEIKLKEPVVKDLIKKSKIKKEVVIDPEKILKSKKTSLVDRLAIIKDNVLKVLGRQKDKVLVIKDKQTFENYITEAIKIGRIAIDTETNNSLIIPGAKLMGLCLYYPGAKQAYIPINHTDLEGNRLSWQCTEQDCKEQLQRLLDANVFRVFHNAKFDYKVIKTTCNIEVTADWDTFIAAKLLDENEFSAGLKQQYISKIDPSQEKYSIDHLFENVEYAVVDPDIFALYAATDSMMTDALYLWQKPRMEAAEQKNPQLNFYKLFKEVEMPCIQVVAEMELNGVLFDTEYADRLRVKFEKQLTEIDNKIAQELANIQPTIATWKETEEATNKSKTYVPAKSKMTAEKIEATYPFIDKNGNRYKESKAKRDQLEDPVNMASPTQLAILLYDILGAPVVDKESPRGTGEEVLQKLKDTIPLCGLLLERRGVVKLLDAFINSLPEEVNPLTGKIHCSFNQYGAATGRFSSSQPNLQQIPSHLKTIRMLFRADCLKHQVDLTNDYYEVPETDDVETLTGWKKVKDLVIGDIIIGQDNQDVIKDIKIINTNYLLYV